MKRRSATAAMRAHVAWLLAGLFFLAARGEARPADLVLIDAKIYTADGDDRPAARRPQAGPTALAVTDGHLVFVGGDQGARRWVGKTTRVIDLHGARVLPGLVDAHVHPMDIVDLDVCNLDSRALNLHELSDFVHACLLRYRPAPGERLIVHQWNYSRGNQPAAEYPSLRVALDRAAPDNPVQLIGNDWHHGAFNSLALASAKNAAGRVVGYSKATLETDFSSFRKLIGVDAAGEPNGAVNEDARFAINPNSMLNVDLDAVLRAPEKIPERLNGVGITAILDAMTSPESLVVFDTLEARGELSLRASLALFYDPERFRETDGEVDYDAMVEQASAIRAKYAKDPLIRADFVKLFADGVLEGDPNAVPPTLPNAASLHDYLQPTFAVDKSGRLTVTGYVDLDGPACAEVRAAGARFEDPGAARRFLGDHGFHPAQCLKSNGQLQHERAVILEFVRRFHVAGFNLHIHVIGDRALRTALDAIEAARGFDGNTSTHDSLAHIQMSSPEDVARIGADRLYVAFTYAWMGTDPDYDMSVIPFLERVHGGGYAALHAPGNLYDRNAYPVAAVAASGGIITAGSDAPVDTPDPRPFVNLAHAVTRRYPGSPALGPKQRISLRSAVDAYTINGARMLGIDREAGSLRVGKSADFIVLDRDIFALAAAGNLDDIAKTQVLQTWFEGRRVYQRKAAR